MKIEFKNFPGRRNYVDVTREESPPAPESQPEVIVIERPGAESLHQRPPQASDDEGPGLNQQDLESLRGALVGTEGEPEAERGLSSASSVTSHHRRAGDSLESAPARRRIETPSTPSSEIRWQPSGTGWQPSDEVEATGSGVAISPPTSGLDLEDSSRSGATSSVPTSAGFFGELEALVEALSVKLR